MNLMCEILSAKILCVSFMCSKVARLMLTISVLQLFTVDFSVSAVGNLYNGAWSHLMVTFASYRKYESLLNVM